MTNNDLAGLQPIELTRQISEGEGVRFDADKITLEGLYRDELSAYRAKKVWCETLQGYFLLDNKQDLSLAIKAELGEGRFTLTCEFLTACARYAFWRLTNNQALEAQYLIETAHIPQCASRQDDFLEVPDLRPGAEGPMVFRVGTPSFIAKIRRFFLRLADI